MIRTVRAAELMDRSDLRDIDDNHDRCFAEHRSRAEFFTDGRPSARRHWTSVTGPWTLSSPVRSRLHDGMTHRATSPETNAPEVAVRVYQCDQLIEQRLAESPESAAHIVESWESRRSPTGERIVVEPQPPEAIVEVLRAVADALEQERPTAMPRPFPDIRVQLVTAGTETTPPKRAELRVLWRELAHPGD